MDCQVCELQQEEIVTCKCGFESCVRCQICHQALRHGLPANLAEARIAEIKRKIESNIRPHTPSSDTETSMELYRTMSRRNA